MKQAHWIRRTHLFRADEYICSVCGASGQKPSPSCPACGATMKKTKYDPSWVDEAEGLSAILDDELNRSRLKDPDGINGIELQVKDWARIKDYFDGMQE